MEIEYPLLSHQLKLIKANALETALVAGYGSGKSKGGVFKHIHSAAKNIGYRSLYGVPIHGVIEDTAIPDFEWVCDQLKIPIKIKRGTSYSALLRFGKFDYHKVLFRSIENWRRWRSLNLSHITLDEIDTIPERISLPAWNMALSRIRFGNFFQLVGVTTPEGYGMMYNRFIKENQAGKRHLIQAKTTDNFHLPRHYVESFLENFPKSHIRAYMNGEFCPLGGETVYYQFDRFKNDSPLTIEYARARSIRLDIGIDFNVRREGQKITGMSAVAHIKDENGWPHAIDEIMGSRDTFALGEAIRAKYPWCNPRLIPDASAKNRSSKGATLTDITILEDQGFSVEYIRENPLIRDRVKIMNAMFLNGKGQRRYKVNNRACPTYTECLEKQALDPDGNPEKGKFDGPNDAGGYYVFFDFGEQMERSNWI